MGINRFQKAVNFVKRMTTGALSDSWYYPGGFFYGGSSGGAKTKSGSQVSEFNALQLEIVWCCIKILSEDIASLPLHLYRRLPNGGKERAVKHPLYSLLHDSPNPEMTAMSFRESYASHILSWGNGYSEKVFGRGLIGRSTIEQLWPITPNRVTVKRNKGEIPQLPLRAIYYHISMSGTGLQDVNLSRKNVFHTPGLGFDGIIGYSPIAYFRESIGLGKTYKEYAELYFGNGTHPSAVVTHPNQVKDIKVMREALSDVYAGLGNAHKLMLLEDNMKFEKVGIPNDEAQFLESQKLSNIDIGTRVYRLFPQQYGEYDKSSTYASAEQFSIDYVTKTLRAWLVRLEQSYNMQLLTREERGEYFFEHNVEGLLRGDAQSRGEFYQKLFAVGGITPNQIAEIENWNPIGPEGDRRFIPLNMIPLDNADDIQRKQSKVTENKSLYRARLAKAYQGIFADAAERVIRKEVKRLRWIAEKPDERGTYDEFYRGFAEYIEKQMLPAFMSYAEAIYGMESELNGIELNGNKVELTRFVSDLAITYAENHIKASREAIKTGDILTILDEWEGERAGEIASQQTLQLADSTIGQIKMLTGGK